jgi:dTMP kinase
MNLVFITFEGIDGCGKTTLAKAVYDKMNGRAYLTHEPTYLKPSLSDPLAVAFMFIADRAEHSLEIREADKRFEYVLCDRYCDSTYAYQGVAISERYGIGVKDAIALLKNAHALLPLPDMTFLVDLSIEEAKKRKDEGFEDRFMQRVREAYLLLAQSEKRIKVLDGRKSTEALRDIVLSHLSSSYL